VDGASTSKPPISGILLAAGSARRMGTSKVLLPWHGRPLVRHLAGVALASQLSELVVVVGHRAGDAGEALQDLPVRVVHNPAYADGQSTSLRAGLAAVSPDAAAAVVLLADQPLVTTQIVDALLAAFWNTSARIVAACAAGRRGNPVLFTRDLFPDLLAISGDEGARRVILTHRDRLHCVEVDEAVFADVDTPEEYAALRCSEAYGATGQ
jgi:molybdenum cofactor cytidylyltransferase